MAKTLDRRAKAFALWQSIPAILKDNKHIQKIKNTYLGPEEEELLPQLLEAKTLKDVSKVLDVSMDTIIYWRKHPMVKKMTEKFDLNCNALRFKNEVNYSFTQATIRNADAARVKLWKQLFEGWEEKTNIGHEINEEQVRDIQSKLREIGSRPDLEKFDVGALNAAIQSKTGGTNVLIGAEQRRLGEGKTDS